VEPFQHLLASHDDVLLDGSVALLAASVVVSGLIEAADTKPRGLLSSSPD
jgi:hypothetical protein